MPESVDLLIEGTVITMDPARRVIRDGVVAVRGDRIVAVDAADGVARATRRSAPWGALAGSSSQG